MADQKVFHIAKSLEYGWDVLTQRWVGLVIWTILLSIPHAMINTAMFIFSIFAQDHKPPTFLHFINIAVNAITFMLYTRLVLVCMDDEPADLANVLSGLRFLIPFTVAGFLFFLAFLAGSCALIFPGIYLFLSLGFYNFLIVDQYMGPIEALKRSWAITRGHLLSLAFLYFVLSMVVFAGLICFMVGVIPASIVSMVALAHVYCQLDQALDAEEEDEEADDSSTGADNHEELEPDEEIAG